MDRILIVDDDETIRFTFQVNLEEKGYQVDTVETGSEALRKIQENPYNLMLIDIKLPDMEGTELLSLATDLAPKIVKIIVTGFPSLDNAMTAVNHGADGYMLKPVDMGNLIRTIEEHLNRQHEEERFDEDRVHEFIERKAQIFRSRITEQEPF